MADFKKFEENLKSLEGSQYMPNDIEFPSNSGKKYGSKFGAWTVTYKEATGKTVSEDFIRNGTWEQLKVVPAYLWKKWLLDKIDSQRVANLVFYTGYNTGTSRMPCLLQDFISQKFTKITVDGIIGNQTIGALNAAVKKDEVKVYDAWREYVWRYYQGAKNLCIGCNDNKRCKLYVDGCTRDVCAKVLENVSQYFPPVAKSGDDALNDTPPITSMEATAERIKAAANPKTAKDWITIALVFGVVVVVGILLYRWLSPKSQNTEGVASQNKNTEYQAQRDKFNKKFAKK
jgi:lysozyme family protein